MKVILAGYNVDKEVLEGMKQGNIPEYLTPETLSAAYARISRDPAPVDELRKASREEVAQARKSNQSIVFGMGHHSVAEHAVFNFDILGLSRLAVEELEKHRLCSYTEKSQRYITLEGDFVTPKEFTGKDLELFLNNLERQNQLYFKTYPQLLELQKNKNPEAAKKKKLLAGLDGKAKEDARYCLGFAIEAQLGFTANSRNLEYVIRDMRNNPLAELRELSDALYQEAKQVAPSLIILADKEGFEETYGATLKDAFLREVRTDRKEALAQLLKNTSAIRSESSGSVRLLDYDKHADDKIIKALVFSDSKLPGLYIDALLMGIGDEKKKDYVKQVLNNLSEFDNLPREWEAANFEYETVISASCFAQMKRHR
ncbi:MAG: FAD-dependent thymidylate synthase, partial [Candidatus Woesearchaeota archaeon]